MGGEIKKKKTGRGLWVPLTGVGEKKKAIVFNFWEKEDVNRLHYRGGGD